MKIDIDGLTESELIDLNNRIVERLRFLKQKRAHELMLKFKIGDRVTFHPEGLPPVVGMLTRYNRKSVTVITDEGQHWNVSAKPPSKSSFRKCGGDWRQGNSAEKRINVG